MDTYWVDAFTVEDKPFTGNPAVVCLLGEREVDTSLLQAIAGETNAPITCFLSSSNGDTATAHAGVRASPAPRYSLRWFTPSCEATCCGHGTLATAAVLFSLAMRGSSEKADSGSAEPVEKMLEEKALSMSTPYGVLRATTRAKPQQCVCPDKGKEGLEVTLDFPRASCVSLPLTAFEELVRATVGPLYPQVVDLQYTTLPARRLLIRVSDSVTRKELTEMKPDHRAMLGAPQSSGNEVQSVIVTKRAGRSTDDAGDESDRCDFVSRVFAPWIGIDEDSATGSAHTVLASYWGQVLSKREMVGFQCSSRGGVVKMSLAAGEAGESRVQLTGKTRIVLQGQFSI